MIGGVVSGGSAVRGVDVDGASLLHPTSAPTATSVATVALVRDASLTRPPSLDAPHVERVDANSTRGRTRAVSADATRVP